MRVNQFDLDKSSSARELVEEIRELQAPPAEVDAEVAEILSGVKAGGDDALIDLIGRFDGAELDKGKLRVDVREITSALNEIDDGIRESLELAAENIRLVSKAQLAQDVETALPQGQSVRQTHKAIQRVGVYVPGGRAIYPTTVLMAAVPAQVAKVHELVVCTPSDAQGRIDPLVLAACAIGGVSEVYRMGGAHAIAALAYGTETVKPVDLVVGPGNRYVQEAKRQVFGRVGIDGLAGPSELMVIADASANQDLVALDLVAQAEHGSESLLVLAGPDSEVLASVGERVEELADSFESVADAALAVVATESVEVALNLSEELAPEHLELACEQSEELAEKVTRAGCVFVGGNGGVAFGDYIAGSNHVLPTGGAARFAGALGPSTFQRRLACVSLPDSAVDLLARHVGRLAQAEGFPAHGESAQARIKKLEKS